MRVKIESTNWYKTDEMIERYPCLVKFGFYIDEEVVPRYLPMKDENGNPMRFKYGTKTIRTPSIDINGMQDIVDLMNAVGHELIIGNDVEPFSIEIYDGFRE